MDIRKFTDKAAFFLIHFCIYYMPKCIMRLYYTLLVKTLSETEQAEVQRRVDYYVRCGYGLTVPRDYRLCGEEKPSIVRLKDFKFPWDRKKKFSAYFLDLYRSICVYPSDFVMAYLFGDIREEFDFPFFVKTRPIKTVSNSVILKLNSARHFQWVKDSYSFSEKGNKAVCRNYVKCQPWRALLLEKYVNHPLCDFGMVNDDDYKEHPEWKKPYLSKQEQLKNKFIMCLEGNDVATNLKWVMSSNSIAVMPKPKFESWFMEGRLVAGYHYIEIADDYSDLEDKIKYYSTHITEAEEIIKHAHEHVARFKNKSLETVTEYQVVCQYFKRTGQL